MKKATLQALGLAAAIAALLFAACVDNSSDGSEGGQVDALLNEFNNPNGVKIATYTITFDANDGDSTSAPNVQTVNAGANITLGSLTRDGFKFVGWNTKRDGTGTDYNVGASYPPKANITLYAKWTPIYTVTFDANDGTGMVPNAQPVDSGGSIQLPSGNNLTKGDSTFGSWNTAADGTGSTHSAGSSYSPTKNITLYVKWSGSSGETDDQSLVLAEGEAWVHQDSGLIFTEDNKFIQIFKHDGIWWYGDTGSYNNYGDIITINSTNTTSGKYSISSDILLLAGLYTYTFTRESDINPEIRYYLTISNNPNPSAGSSVSRNPNREFYFFGEQVTVTAYADTAAAYKFTKWTGASTETTSATTITMDGNKTLTAGFELITYTITFDANGGTPVTPTSGKTGEYYKLASLPSPARDGYIFIGWYTAAEGGTAVTTSTQLRADATIYAGWEERSGVVYGPSVEYGSETYQTVVIGEQTWFARNLNYDVPDDATDVCNNNNPDNCAKYGRLYNWATAMDIDASYNSTNWGESDVMHQGICPNGWHIPSDEEWATLIDYVGGRETAGTKLKSSTDWDSTYVPAGTNEYGFSALPGGYGFTYGGFACAGNCYGNSFWWSATEYGGARMVYTGSGLKSMERSYIEKATLSSVRCVAD